MVTANEKLTRGFLAIWMAIALLKVLYIAMIMMAKQCKIALLLVHLLQSSILAAQRGAISFLRSMLGLMIQTTALQTILKKSLPKKTRIYPR